MLIVDDDDAIRDTLAEIFASSGFQVDTAVDGAAALAALRGGPPPDALLLDLMMPRMDGWALRVAQLQDPALAQIPAVVMSAADVKAHAVDADAFIAKPCEAAEVLHAVEKAILRREQARAEEAQQRSERSLRSFIEMSPEPALVHRDGRIVFVNAAMLAFLGYDDAGELIGRPALSIVEPAFRPVIEARIATLQEGRPTPGLTQPILRRDGAIRLAEFVGVPVEYHGEPAVAAIARDVTERRQAEDLIRASEARLRALVDSSPLAIIACDLAGRVLSWNRKAEQLYGYREDEVAGQIHPLLADRPGRFERVRDTVRSTGGIRDMEETRLARDGREVHVLLNLAALRDASGEMIGIVSMAQDVTEARRVERALRQSEQTLQAVAANFPLVLIATDAHGIFTVATGRGLAVAGLRREELIGRSIFEAYAGQPWALRAARAVLGGEDEATATGEAHGRVFEVHYRPLRDAQGRVNGMVGVALDVTERRQLEDKLLLSDRMASMGRLAAGVAHEINNPLAFTLANLEFVHRELDAVPGAEPLKRALQDALQGAERVRRIVRDLKLLSRTGERTSAIDLHAALESSLSLTSNEIRHRARLVKDLGNPPPVRGDEGRIGQVFVNLLVNAAQAIPEGNAQGNEIRVSTSTSSAGEAVVEIADTGQGIPAELRGRLFDPFFTTKPIGVGTGLGLSICHGIVSSLGGRIEVKSEVGRGSAFRVILPAAPPAAAPAPEAATEAAVAPAETRRARVLVVDDEPSLGAAIRRLLSMHEVVVVTLAREALRRIDGGERFDVILCDLMMPDLTGMDLHAELQRRSPAVAASMVFMSGGTFTPRAEEFLASVSNARVEKPLQLHQLRRLVAERVA